MSQLRLRLIYDPVGLGKSIMLASLIHTNRGPEPVSDTRGEGSTSKAKLKLDSAFRPKAELSADATAAAVEGPSCTLIVAPVSLLSQWRSELVRFRENGKSTLSLHFLVS